MGLRWQQIALGGILLLALGLRVVYILQHGQELILNSDDVNYMNSAYRWLQTGVFTYKYPDQPTVFITPGFPALLAAVFGLGGDAQTVRLVHAVLTTFSVYLTYRIGKDAYSEGAGLLAALFMALWPPNLVATGLILTEPLFQVFLLGLIWATLHLEKPKMWWAFGLIWGIGTLVRPTLALVPVPLLVVWLWGKRIPWKGLATAGVIFCVVMSPWWIRNYTIHHEFIPLAVSSGNPLLGGAALYGEPVKLEPGWEYPPPNEYDTDKFEAAYAKHIIIKGFTENTAEYARWYFLIKPVIMWKFPYYWRMIPGLPGEMVTEWYWKLLAVCGAGLLWMLAMGREQRRATLLFAGLISYFTVVHLVYFAMDRYVWPLLPLVLLFGSGFLTDAGRRLLALLGRSGRVGKGFSL